MDHTRAGLVSARIPSSRNVAEASERFLDEVGDWVHACVRRYGSARPTDVHDQGTYTTSWEPWIRTRDTGPVRRFLTGLRDDIAGNFRRAGQWRHGYWRMHDVHHGTEHFELFLGMLSRLDRRDASTMEQLVDVVEHLGNWSEDVPPWFDWESGLFHAKVFGTEGVRQQACDPLNVPDHLRCVNLSLLVYELTGVPRYLTLAARHGERWVQAILAEPRLPVAMGRDGPIYEAPELDLKGPRGQAASVRRPLAVVPRVRAMLRRAKKRVTHRRVVTIDPRPGPPEVDNAERFLASNGVVTFLELWRLTGERRFKDAAERLMGPLVTQLADPDAGTVAQVVRAYRAITGDDRYDRDVLAAAGCLAPWSFADLSVDTAAPRYSRQPGGVGKRKDMVTWFEDGRPRQHSPMLLALAAELRSDEALAARAVDLARTYFTLARRVFPDGRDHGCAARSVSAIARGHGRDNDTGVVTGVLAPMLSLSTLRRTPAR